MEKNRTEEIARLTKELAKATQDRKRTRILLELSDLFYLSDTVVALDYAERAAKLARKSEDGALLEKVLVQLGRCRYRTSDFSGAAENYKEALPLAQSLGNQQEIVKLYYLLGNIHLSQGEYAQAMTLYNDCLELAEPLGDKASMEFCFNNLGIVYRSIGDLYTAFDYHTRGLKLCLELELEDIGPIYLNLAIMYYEMHQPEKALEYYEMAYDAAKINNNTLCIVKALTNKGVLLTDEKKYDDAVLLFHESIEQSRAHDFHQEHAKALERLGYLFTQTGHLPKALSFYNEALALCERYEAAAQFTNLLSHKAQLLFDMDRTDEARAISGEGLEVVLANGKIPAQAEFYNILAQCDKREKKFEEALAKTEKYNELRERTYRDDEQRLLREAHIRLEVEQAMQDHLRLKLEKELLEQNLAAKKQELTALALQLSKQNETLGKVTSQLKETMHSERGKTQAPVDNLISEIERLRNSESDWEFFTSQFNVIHADFTTKLLTKYPDLSPKEVKVCLLMKLNLSTKDIANSLCLSNRTVEVHRYQIRKKIALSQEENLHNFLTSFN